MKLIDLRLGGEQYNGEKITEDNYYKLSAFVYKDCNCIAVESEEMSLPMAKNFASGNIKDALEEYLNNIKSRAEQVSELINVLTKE